jgi:hypothetical protein
MIVELRSVPGCPNLAAIREVLTACVAELSDAVGMSVSVIERVREAAAAATEPERRKSLSLTIAGADVHMRQMTVEPLWRLVTGSPVRSDRW